MGEAPFEYTVQYAVYAFDIRSISSYTTRIVHTPCILVLTNLTGLLPSPYVKRGLGQRPYAHIHQYRIAVVKYMRTKPYDRRRGSTCIEQDSNLRCPEGIGLWGQCDRPLRHLCVQVADLLAVFGIDEFDLGWGYARAALLRSFEFGIDCIAQSANWIKLNTEYVKLNTSNSKLRI